MGKFAGYFHINPGDSLQFPLAYYYVWDKFDIEWIIRTVMRSHDGKEFYFYMDRYDEHNTYCTWISRDENELLLSHERIPQTNLGKLLYG